MKNAQQKRLFLFCCALLLFLRQNKMYQIFKPATQYFATINFMIIRNPKNFKSFCPKPALTRTFATKQAPAAAAGAKQGLHGPAVQPPYRFQLFFNSARHSSSSTPPTACTPLTARRSNAPAKPAAHGVECPKDHPADTSVPNGARAHQAGFERHGQRAVVQPPVSLCLRGHLQGQHLGVKGGIFALFASVVRPGNDPAPRARSPLLRQPRPRQGQAPLPRAQRTSVRRRSQRRSFVVDAHQRQPLGRRGRAGVGAVARGEDLRHFLRRALALADLKQRAYNDAHHVV